MDDKISRDISFELYKLLKVPLKLHDQCINFTLECNLEGFPKVTEEYWVQDTGLYETKTETTEITDFPMTRNNEY